jgi:hypothetical protein
MELNGNFVLLVLIFVFPLVILLVGISMAVSVIALLAITSIMGAIVGFTMAPIKMCKKILRSK